MAKTILIPVDFRVESLNTLKKALEEHQHKDVLDVILIYSEFLSDSITELLFYSPGKRIKTLLKPGFEQALSIIKNGHSDKIKFIRFELFHSTSPDVLNNFLKAQNICEIYCPKTYRLKLSGSAFDLVPLLKKSKLPFFEIHWPTNNNSSEDHLATLFT
ncbi:MAG TPA: hypothetical protein PL029_08580 [Bacteroidia bacterium]|nr:hypothetical protein [Bacteroidia bacterium]